MYLQLGEAGESWTSFVGMGAMTQFGFAAGSLGIPKRCAHIVSLI